MRWTLRITALLCVLLVGYTVWPFVDLYRLGRALQRGDAVELSERIEMRALRPSLARQVLASYLRLAGKDAKIPDFLKSTALGLGAGIADRALGQAIEPDQITQLIRDALARTSEGGEPRNIAALVPRNLGAIWTLYAGSEYRLHNFYVAVPPSFPRDERFRLHLRLTQWTWKLNEIELPETLRERLAEMLLKRNAATPDR
jgi:hypothetical protein